MPANDIYELNVDQTYAGQAITNTHHFRQDSDDGTGDARTACMNMWDVEFKPEYLDCVVADVAMVQYRCRRIKPVETQSLILAATGVGDIALEGLPPQSCSILRQHAVPSGRKGTGHVKLSGMSVAGVDQGRLDASLAALLAAYGLKMLTEQEDVASGYFFRSGVYSLIDSVIRDVVKTVVTPRIKTVYSRAVGVGD